MNRSLTASQLENSSCGKQVLPQNFHLDNGMYPLDISEVEEEVGPQSQGHHRFVPITEIAECDCDPGACICHILDPREALEAAEENDTLGEIREGRMSITDAIAELGTGFRVRIAEAGLLSA